MQYSTILFEVIDAVARITLNRPERANALNQAMLGEIGAALDAAEGDAAVRALVVQGAGAASPRASTSRSRWSAARPGVAQWEPILRKTSTPSCASGIRPKPTIAAVRGACLAGAFELALACDLTIAADDAFFGEPELKFGAGIVVMLLPWIVGPKIAKEIILTGEDRHRAPSGPRDRHRQSRRAGDRARRCSALRARPPYRRHRPRARAAHQAGDQPRAARRAACSRRWRRR